MKTGAAPGAGAVWALVVASWPMATAAASTRARAIATSTAPIWRVPSGCWTVRVEADIGPSCGVRPGSELFVPLGPDSFDDRILGSIERTAIGLATHPAPIDASK